VETEVTVTTSVGGLTTTGDTTGVSGQDAGESGTPEVVGEAGGDSQAGTGEEVAPQVTEETPATEMAEIPTTAATAENGAAELVLPTAEGSVITESASGPAVAQSTALPPHELPVTGTNTTNWSIAPLLLVTLVIMLVLAGVVSLFSSSARR
jgi:hypothetical protein